MICTYLNSHLLEAPLECIIHGLDPGLDWASFWPFTSCAFRVATPHSVSCCLSQMDRVSHLSPSLLSGWLLQVNNTTTLYDTHGHAYIHHIGIPILLSSFFLTLPPSFLAGRLVQTLPVWYNNENSRWTVGGRLLVPGHWLGFFRADIVMSYYYHIRLSFYDYLKIDWKARFNKRCNPTHVYTTGMA